MQSPIPSRYHHGVAMTLRLTDEETEALRIQAEREHRSMHEVVRLAIADRVSRTARSDEILAAGRAVRERDAKAMRLLAQ